MMRELGRAAQARCRAAASAAERGLRSGLIGLVKGYRLLLSPWLGASCRFMPTCSVYALQALERHGAGRGSYLTLARLARCHPWCEGGLDEVPGCEASSSGSRSDEGGQRSRPAPGLFSRLLSPPSQKNLHE